MKCGEKTTLNNTYWRNPPSVSSDTSCSLTFTLDNSLIEQRKPICQVRYDANSYYDPLFVISSTEILIHYCFTWLTGNVKNIVIIYSLDFKSFTVAQPNPATSHCDSDYRNLFKKIVFSVLGSSITNDWVPVLNEVRCIVGHSYLEHWYLTHSLWCRLSQFFIPPFNHSSKRLPSIFYKTHGYRICEVLQLERRFWYASIGWYGLQNLFPEWNHYQQTGSVTTCEAIPDYFMIHCT